MAFKMNRNFNVGRVIKRVIYLFISLFVGGITLQFFLKAMNGTCSPLYQGLSILGVSVAPSNCTTLSNAWDANTITSPTFSNSILGVLGIIGVAGILLTEFVNW